MSHDAHGWSRFEAEAAEAFRGPGRFPIRAYSEWMPPPYIGMKPVDPRRASGRATAWARDDGALDVSEYELEDELRPGLARIADAITGELERLERGTPNALSRALLEGNEAWPASLAGAARAGELGDRALVLALPLALSRTQDDKGNVRWTLFGASHDGAERPFWQSFGEHDRERFGAWLAFARKLDQVSGLGAPRDPFAGVRIVADPADVPGWARPLLLAPEAGLAGDTSLTGVEVLVTLRPFGALAQAIQQAYLARQLTFLPSPASLVFFHHPGYRALAQHLPRARQIALLHVFPRVEARHALRIPQSGWIEERKRRDAASASTSAHRMVPGVARSHRWQRVARDHGIGADASSDKVAVALFSTDPDDLGLYGKPMAKNAQIWREDYSLLLDGARATPAEVDRAAAEVRAGGQFGYRFYYPPMRAGVRELFWHLPLVGRREHGGETELCPFDAAPGYVSAEHAHDPKTEALSLAPRLLSRPLHRDAATLFPHDPGRPRNTTEHNVRKLFEFRELLASDLPPSFARRLVRIPKDEALETWLARLATDPSAAERVVPALRALIGPADDHGLGRTFAATAQRAFEEALWRDIASLAEGPFREKDNADVVAANAGKSGGPAAQAARIRAGGERDLERLADHLHARYRAIIARHGMSARAASYDHAFRWHTDFDFSWSSGWRRSQAGPERERNVVVIIPGNNRHEALIMADHYDTAYMEDVYESARGGDGLRAAAHGADDNHSATSALFAAAEALLPLARAGKLVRDVWLVHLTGEEFPADCLGARALAQGLVEHTLELRAPERAPNATESAELAPPDVAHVEVVGAFVLDMIGHNADRARDIFQIAPGEGRRSAALALAVHRANERWNEHARRANREPERRGKGRAARMPNGADPPPPFAHLELAGEVRCEWEPRSALYNTDGQIFSDVGIPVVLLMENYDITRSGYHDTHDTMKNIDLDYAAALAAIAIEAVADVACTP